jgi:hypothetical protein
MLVSKLEASNPQNAAAAAAVLYATDYQFVKQFK